MPEHTTGTILGPNGEPVTIPTVLLSNEDARLLREYKKFLERYGLREALYCTNCWNNSLHDGCEAFVTGGQIAIKCRCKLRFYQGSTF